MLQLYTPIFLLQAFCLYHAYVHKSPYWWLLMIAFVPLLGCAFYLYAHFYAGNNLDTVSELVKQPINKNYTVDKLVTQAHVADTISNKVRLADEYMNSGDFDQAIVLYESCLTGFNADDPDTLMKLLFAFFKSEQYSKVMELGTQLKETKVFYFSDAKLAYAQSAAFTENHDLADKIFNELNVRFANHSHRLAYAEYLVDGQKNEDALALLESLVDETNHMDDAERRLKRDVIRSINTLYGSLQS